MDRSIAYTQEQGRSTDFLFAQRASMIGLGQLAQAMLGSRTLVFGLGVTPTTPASLSVDVAAGQIYSVQPVDATAYGVLAADTTDQIVKQGIALQAQTLALTAPSTAGYSINYLIEATYEDQDTNPAVLPYFNSANPSQPLSGQNNSGAAQATQRQGVLVLTLKAGAAAPTGSQTTPAPDSGYVGVAVVTVANGQTQITGANITQLVGGALFANLLQAMQGATAITAPDTGTVNALAITLSPAPAALTPGMMVAIDNIVASNNGPSTLNVNGLGALPIQLPGGSALVGGELVAEYGALFRLNHAGTAWDLLLSTGGGVYAPANASLSNRNRIHNGDFRINQRAVSGTVTLAAGAYGHDRWKAGAGGCTYTFAASGNGYVLTISAGSLMQVVDSTDVEGGNYVLSQTGTAQARIAVNGGTPSGAYAACPLTATATGGQTITVEFSTGTVSKVQLEPGSTPTPFEQVAYARMLDICQRYFIAGQAMPVLNNGTATTNVSMTVYFPVQMRASPTVNVTSATATYVSSNGFSTYFNTTAGAWTPQASYTASADL